MTEPTAEDLTAAYQALRQRTIALGRSLDAEASAAMSPCCPAWSVKDLFAHMVGVPSDILDGNTEGAATEAWADAQVERRAELDLAAVLDEWERRGPSLDDVLLAVGPKIAYQFFIDAWTHEWDIRQAIGAEPAAPDYSLIAHTLAPLLDNLTDRLRDRDLLPATLVIHGLATGPHHATFDAASSDRSQAAIELSLFEFMRIAMGRRSRGQIESALGVADLLPGDWADGFVVWSINETDIIDPVTLA